jgi:hypothetical protein
MKTDLIKINPADYGLEESKAQQIAAQFKPMLDKMVELEREYNEVIKLPVEDAETAVKAKELRLQYVKVRTGTEKIHKEQKAFYLAGGRFVDGWKNAQLFASQGLEDNLKEIETYQERLEAERIEKIRSERWGQINQYTEIEPFGLSTMDENTFNALLSGYKANYEAKIEAERQAELARIEAERKLGIFNARKDIVRSFGHFFNWDSLTLDTTDADFDHLINEAKELQLQAEKEREELRIKAAKEAKENERLRKEAEAKRIESEKEAKRIEQERQAERNRIAELERIENERKTKEAAEIEAQKKAALAGDKEKLNKWVNSLSIEIAGGLKPEGQKVANQISEKFEAFKKWAFTQINTQL